MEESIVISNPEGLEKTKKAISKDGAEKLHVLADFDRTLTTAFVDGKSTPSLMAIIRDGNYLTPEYAKAAQELYIKYHPFEIDPKISLTEKKKAMEDWWMSHFDLLIKLGFKKSDIERAVNSGKIKLREGAGDFLNFLRSRRIPLVIMSSSGIGCDAIPMFFKKEGKLGDELRSSSPSANARVYDNVFIISNSIQWDKNGRAMAINLPIIHSMNKDDMMACDFPVFEAIKDRRNVLLLGDVIGDVGMVEGFGYDNLLKIGFLNENVEENLEQYKNSFDVVLMNDSSLNYINELLKEIIK